MVFWSNKELKIIYQIFWDKLLFGVEEIWEFKISGLEKEVVVVELVVGMYDVFLDVYCMYNWYFSFFLIVYSCLNWVQQGFLVDYGCFFFYNRGVYFSVDVWQYWEFDWYNWNCWYRFVWGNVFVMAELWVFDDVVSVEVDVLMFYVVKLI